MPYPPRELFRNFLSVVAGVLTGMLTGTPFMLAAALLNFSDAAIPAAQQALASVLAAAGWLLAPLAAGYCTAFISTRRTTAHLLITGTVLIFLILSTVSFQFASMPFLEQAGTTLLIPLVLTGGYWYQKRKNQR